MRRHGHARVNPRSPRAFATCDRCGLLYNHEDLVWQSDWRGRNLQNLRLLVCDTCLDVPQEQLRVIVLPPDPLPIPNARPELADIESTTLPIAITYRLTGASGSFQTTGHALTPRRSIQFPLATPGSRRAFSRGFSLGFGPTATPSYGISGSDADLADYPGVNPRGFSSGFGGGFL